MKKLFNIIKNENPVFVFALGLTTALAVTTKVEDAYIIGLCVILILFFSNLIMSALKKIISKKAKILIYLLVVGSLITILELLIKENIPIIYDNLGIYLPLIIMNSVIAIKGLDIISKEPIKKGILNSLGLGLIYIITLILIAFLREVLGFGTITLMDGISSITGYRSIIVLPANDLFPISLFATPAGGFIIIGFLMAISNKIRGGKKNESN